jgi:3-hydroxybutyryl-CoA dehydrogenase
VKEQRNNSGVVDRVAVIGAGLMGHGVAQVFASHGCSVKLYDINATILNNAIDRVNSNLQLYVEMGLEDQSWVDAVLSRIETTTSLRQAVEGAGFITEAVFEDLELKRKVFREIDAETGDDVVMASNTSNLSMTGIAKGLAKSDRLLITHWFNPPHLVPVVEVLKTAYTSEEAFTFTFDFLRQMGKEPVHVLKEVPGFLVNRIQTAMFREVVGLLEAGVASAEDIDKAVKGSFGLRLSVMGPLKVADLGGVDLWYKGTKALYPLFDNSTEPQKLLTEMVEKGLHGKKTGKGFFDYPTDSKTDVIKERDMKLIALLNILYGDKNKQA